MEIPTVKELAAFGLKPSDFETSKIEEIVAAAKEFERLLNGASCLLDVDVIKTTFWSIGEDKRNKYEIQITALQQVYP